MPALTYLYSRLQEDDAWSRFYNERIDQAKAAADKIPLVHVTTGENFLQIILNDPPELLPSVRGRSKPKTLAAEGTVSLPPSVYFYAGRAYEDHGDVALAFDGECHTCHTGAATPFDTGGLVVGRIKWRETNGRPRASGDFIKASTIPLTEWRKAFADFLAGYFMSLLDYWLGRPHCVDQEGIFDEPENEARAWIFEIRFHEGHNMCGHVAWSYTGDVWRQLRPMMGKEPPAGALDTPLRRFFQDAKPLTPVGAPNFCEVMEGWIREQAGV